MQGSIRDFSIVKNLPQYNSYGVLWKNKKNQGHSIDKKQYVMGKKAYINAEALEFFGEHRNKLAIHCAHLLSSPGSWIMWQLLLSLNQ